jgi:hypothetical protein
MNLADRFRQFMRPYLDKWMSIAQKDPDISYEDYKELRKIYKEIYKHEHKL